MFVHDAEDRGADCDAEAKEEGVDDGIDHAYRAGDNVAGLQFKGPTDCGCLLTCDVGVYSGVYQLTDDIAWKNERDG